MIFNNNEPLELDPSRYVMDLEISAFAEVVHDETENRRVSLGGMRGGNRNVMLASLLVRERPTDGQLANTKYWFEFLTDSIVVKAVGRRMHLKPDEFLTMCMKTFHLPNWEALFWMKAFYESVANECQIELQFAQREQVILKQARSEMAKIGAQAKLANDPKQIAKAQVRECWDKWQRNPSSYTSKSAFARDMLDKDESLKNQAVIAGWCLKWSQENEHPASQQSR